MTIIHSTIEPRKHVRVTPIGDQDVALDIGRPGRPAVSLMEIRIPVAELRGALDEFAPAGSYTHTDEDGLTLCLVQQQRDQATARAERAERDAPPERACYTCVDCNSGDMVEDAARWHESHEGHVVKELDDEEEQD